MSDEVVEGLVGPVAIDQAETSWWRRTDGGCQRRFDCFVIVKSVGNLL